MVKAILSSRNVVTEKFSVETLLTDIQLPDYQRNIVWKDHQIDAFIINCLLQGTPIPPMTLLYTGKITGNTIDPEECYLIDGLQRRNALYEFIVKGRIVQYNGNSISFKNIDNRKKVLNHPIIFNYIVGTHADGDRWIDNEQKRVSHTAGDYLYRKKDISDMARMTHEIVSTTKQTLFKYLNKDAMHGHYIIDRDEDFYPFIAGIIAYELGITPNKREIPTCWPDREGYLWLEREDIKSLSYDKMLVSSMINRINNISEVYTPQILPDILCTRKKPVTSHVQQINVCKALKASGDNKGKICGFKAKQLNKYHNRPCCGFHWRETVMFQD